LIEAEGHVRDLEVDGGDAIGAQSNVLATLQGEPESACLDGEDAGGRVDDRKAALARGGSAEVRADERDAHAREGLPGARIDHAAGEARASRSGSDRVLGFRREHEPERTNQPGERECDASRRHVLTPRRRVNDGLRREI